SRLPHCSQKHASGGLIVATIVRCLTGLLICLPRRLGRECPDHAPPYTHQQVPHPRVHHPGSPQPLVSAFIHAHYGLALYVDGTARRQAPGAGKALTHSRALPMIAFSCHEATSAFSGRVTVPCLRLSIVLHRRLPPTTCHAWSCTNVTSQRLCAIFSRRVTI